ncbi:MAG: hypothetical protein J6P60_04320 [Lachnospiraceae bacterium]|nr:hypothetical protein [Lachnospiraceae bacterium]
MDADKKRFDRSNGLLTWLQTHVFLIVTGVIIFAMVLFCLLRPDNLMHSDMAAEVILSKLLADQKKLITRDWFYSTEIRIVYSHLLMTPLFYLFDSYRLVKYLSVFLFYALMLGAYCFVAKRMGTEKRWSFLGLALLFSPLSNEYLDMMFVGCFYSSQLICTYLILGGVLGWIRGKAAGRGGRIFTVLWMHIAALVLGLSGLRYLASLFLPMLLAAAWILFTEEESLFKETLVKNEAFLRLVGTATLLVCAAAGFLINKGYLARHYSFDSQDIVFVELSQIPERFLNSMKLMVEFFGYYPVEAASGRGIVNVLKFALLLFVIGAIAYLWHVRHAKLSRLQRFLLYYFIGLFLLNWYLLVFTSVLMQYRYWIPVYIIAVLLIAVFFEVFTPQIAWQKSFCAIGIALAVLSSLYGELWQDAKYNDCEKRYGYMQFLEQNDYTFGYATFWNAPVTEYLSNGKIEVGNLGGENGVAAPYEWLSKKDLYREGYHTGKTFLLLARTEEAGMLKGDFTVMPDGVKVYEDEYYAIYEGEGMYLFSE